MIPNTSITSSSANGNSDKNDDTDNSKYMIEVSETLPTIQECMDFVNDPSCGAISSFVGITRNTFQGKTVTKLSYEAYMPMATKQLLKLCQEATTKFGVSKIAAVHIIGDCPVGQASVILTCSSPHRKNSIQCIEYLIDTLKATVPIWKRECYDDDEYVWKENIEWKHNKVTGEKQKQRIMVKSNISVANNVQPEEDQL